MRYAYFVTLLHRTGAAFFTILAVVSATLGADFEFVRGPLAISGRSTSFLANIAMGDLNGDGKVDAVVVLNQGPDSEKLFIFAGNGDGSFSFSREIATPSRQLAMDVGDINGDGKMDLVSIGSDDSLLRTFLGNGGGTFTPGPVISGTGGTNPLIGSLKLADITGDGKPDAVCGDINNGIRVLKGDGQGGFSPYMVFDQGGGVNTESLNVLDIDGDGAPDIVYSPRFGGDMLCITQIRTANTAFTVYSAGLSSAKNFAVGRDASGQVVFAISEVFNNQPGRMVFGRDPLHPRDTGFVAQMQRWWGVPAIVDLNRDGILDLAITHLVPGVNPSVLHIYSGNATGIPFPAAPTRQYATGVFPTQVFAKDLNRDGGLDLVVGTIGGFGGATGYTVYLQQVPLVITSADNVSFEEGTSGTFSVTTNSLLPVTFSVSGSLPAGVTFGSQGLLSGTPQAGTRGEYLVTIIATLAGTPPVSRNLLLTVTPPLVPRLNLPNAQNVTTTSATLQADLQTDNGFPITRRGVVYAPTAVNPNPQLGGAGVFVVDGSTLTGGPFDVQATGLTPGTAYSFVAFAQNARGVGYTSVATFFTPPDPNSGSLVVTTLTDENNGNSAPSLGTGTSLREAIAYARTLGGNQTITFLPSLTAGSAATTTLSLGEIVLQLYTGTLTIAGPGADRLRINAGANARIFRVENVGLELNGLTLANAAGSDGGAIRTTGTLTVNDCVFTQNTSATNGGAIYQLGGTTTVMRSTFTGNAAVNPAGNPFTGLGGAIASDGAALWVINSTFFGNSATTNGGGGGGAIVTTQSQATTRIINSTIVGNSADGASGGVQVISGNVVVQNTIVAGNTAPFEPNINSGIPTAGLGNVIGGNIADLFTTAQPANNGGTTPTFALKAGSAAINAGINALAVGPTGATLTTDQLGGLRLRSTAVDAGSTEAIFAPAIGAATLANLTSTSATLGGNVLSDGGALRRRGVIFSRTADNANPALGGNGAIVVEVPGTSGVFSTPVNLAPRTGYSFVAFVESDFGVLYSSVVTFTTPEFPSLEVTTTSETVDPADGQTSLREAITYAMSGTAGTDPVITFDPTVFASAQTITLAGTQLPTLTQNVTINGPAVGVIVSGNNQSRIFQVNAGTVNLNRLTVSGGRSSVNDGGGIVQFGGTLKLSDSTVSDNVAADSANGGGIAVISGSLALSNCTLTGNSTSGTTGAAGNGGAIYNAGGDFTLRNCTLTGNQVNDGGSGGAIHSDGGNATLVNCTVSGNVEIGNYGGGVYGAVRCANTIIAGNSSFGPDVGGAVQSLGNNIIGRWIGGPPFVNGVNGDQVGTVTAPLIPLLGPLANNGGPTQTMALLPGSPAIDAGNTALAVDASNAPLATDQRGGFRVRFSSVDIGAFEADLDNLGITPIETGDGALWYLGPTAIGGDLRVYRELPGQPAEWVDGRVAQQIGQAADGTIIVRTAGGVVFARPGSTTGRGSAWQQLTAVAAKDGATWFLGPDGVGSEFYIYRWATGGTPIYSGGLGAQLSVTGGGVVRTTTAGGVVFERTGSNIGLGTAWAQVETPSLVVTMVADVVNSFDFQTSLREAITFAMTGAAGTDPVITFDPTVFASARTIALFPDPPLILTQNVTISGPATGVAISGDGRSRVFLVNAGTVSLNRLTITRGFAAFINGGAIVQYGGTLKLSECTVSESQTTSYGGGIAVHSGTLELLSCTFSGNAGGGVGSSLPGAGGALFIENGTVRATNCTFNGNRTVGVSGGGAIYNESGDITLVNCTIVGNLASGLFTSQCGGVQSVGGTVRCANTIIAGNAAVLAPDARGVSSLGNNLIGVWDGGPSFVDGVNGDRVGTSASPLDPLIGVLASNGGLTQTMALLPGSPAIDAGNTALAVDASDAPLATDQRGAIRVTRGKSSSPGARVDIGAYELMAAPTFTQSNLTATIGGAALDLATLTGPSPAGGTFSGTGVNSTTGVFDATGLAPGTVVTVTYTISDGSGATNQATFTVTVKETPSLLVTTANDVTDPLDGLTSLREAVAYAQSLGGGPTITFAPALAGQTVTLVEGATGANDDTALRNGSDLTIEGGAGVTINLAATVPRRLFAHTGGTLNLRNLTLSGGDLRNLNDGGALFNSATVNLTNVRFTSNHANSGGAVINFGTMTVETSTFDNNDAPTGNGQGGAIWNNGTLGISGSTFFQNSAGVLGGAIASFQGLTVSASNFSTNHSDFNGGAVRLDGSATISSSTFSNNTAANGGGAVMSHGATTLTNVTIAYNVALDGGGIQFFDGVPSVRHATIAYNTATRFGGGIAVNFADVTLTNTLVAGNAETSAIGSFNTASSNNLLHLTDVQAGLGAFANNGGPNPTIALLPGSPAINSGVSIAGLTTDQRGLARSVGGAPDIGALEDATGDDDPDRDSLTSFAEFLAGTNALALDTDGDGFNDATETMNGSDPKLATSVPTGTHIERVLGIGAARGLDLTGHFLYAVNVGTNGAPGQIGDASFTADTVAGVTVTAGFEIANWTVRDFGSTSEDDRLEAVFRSLRFDGPSPGVKVDAANLVPGRNYKLQLLFAEGPGYDRAFDVSVNGITVVPNFNTNTAQGVNLKPYAASAIVHTFTAPTSTLQVALTTASTSTPFDPNPILNGFTLEEIPTAATAPMITPLAGTYTGSVTVSLATTSAGADIRYTLDGSAPSDVNGFTYTAPFDLTASATVRAIAVGGGWLASPESSASYTVLPRPIAGADTIFRYPSESTKVTVAALLVNDSSPSGRTPLQITAVGPAASGRATVTLSGGFVFYLPASGFTGADSFTYTLADSDGTTATGTVTVALVDDQQPTQNVTTLAFEDAPGGGRQLRVKMAGIPGRTYRIQSTDNLAPANWETLATVTADATGAIEFIDPPPLPPRRFYRTITP